MNTFILSVCSGLSCSLFCLENNYLFFMNQLKCHLLSKLPLMLLCPLAKEPGAYPSGEGNSQVPTLSFIIFYNCLHFWIVSTSRSTTVFYLFSCPHHVALVLAHKKSLRKCLPNE